MRLSVIIPTYNRGDRIVSTLTAITQLQPPPDEVIIVIDGSTDNTAEVVKKFSDQLPLKVVEIPNGGRSVARNTGVAHSTGELLVFFDDDMRPFPECLADHLKHHEKYPGSLFVGAIREDEKLFTSDIQKYRLTLYERKGWVQNETTEMQPMNEGNLYLAAANFSISRKSFDALKGFDERLRDSEDFDLGARALRDGFQVFGSNSSAFAYHDDPITCRYYIMRQRQYYNSRKMLQQFRPELYKNRAKNYAVKVSGSKRALFSLFSNSIMVSLVDSGILKWMLPQQIRYRFYDLVIGGMSDVFPDRKL
jgi:glycosyltransferase involved in cell wall biosynthesis